jgi:hypothetical protein
MVGGGAPREVTEEDLVKRLLGEDWVGASGRPRSSREQEAKRGVSGGRR